MNETKHVVFDGGGYTVPVWVSWVARNTDGVVRGYQYEPFEDYAYDRGYTLSSGQVCVIYSPDRTTKLERV